MNKIAQYRLFLILVALIFWGGQAVAEENACDGYKGAAYGLCNAYCEAMDCDSEAYNASEKACDVIYLRFEKLTGAPPPCEEVQCPAWHSGELDLVFKTFTSSCSMDDKVLHLPHNPGTLEWGDAEIYDDDNYVYASIQWYPSLLAVYGEVIEGVELPPKVWQLKDFEAYQACRDQLAEHTAQLDCGSCNP
jgi:hypothetical protein